MNTHSDKITLDLTDNRELSDLLSRRSAGNTVSGRFTATIDEVSERMATLSIDSIQVEGGSEAAKPDPEPKEDDAPAVKVFKSRGIEKA